MSRVVHLSLEDALTGAEVILGPGPRVRDLGLLASALDRPRTTVFGEDAYPSLLDKAAALLHSVVSNHPFIDGNKRMGWAIAAAFCEVNGITLHHSADEAFELVMDVASGRLPEVDKIAERLHLFAYGPGADT